MKRTHIILFAITIVAITLSIISLTSKPKIGVVDFKRLVNEFQGMKDATNAYEVKMKDWNHISDSLTTSIKTELSNYYADSAFITAQERTKRESKIILMRNNYLEFSKGLEQNAIGEDEKMTIEVVNKVLIFVEKYGENNGYDLILGKNEGDDVLYRRSKLDITEDILIELNKNYDGF